MAPGIGVGVSNTTSSAEWLVLEGGGGHALLAQLVLLFSDEGTVELCAETDCATQSDLIDFAFGRGIGIRFRNHLAAWKVQKDCKRVSFHIDYRGQTLFQHTHFKLKRVNLF